MRRALLASKLLWGAVVVLLALAGVWLRAQEIGTWGLSNDEAWVALSTRVEGLRQFWLAIAMTPVAWAALLKIDALAVEATETTLRAVPFVFGCLTMWAAYRAGIRFAEHRLGGVLALAAVAFDRASIAYAKILKQYTAEALLCVLAVDRAAAFARRRTGRDLLVLGAVLILGLPFANAQLFVAPAVLGALLVDALWRRDARVVRMLVVAALAVGAWYAAYHWLVIAPRLPAAGDRYWSRQIYLPPTIDAPGMLWERFSTMLAPTLGRWGAPAAAVCLALGCILPRQRVASLSLLFLVVGFAGLSALRVVPVSQPRILLFLTTGLAVYGAAAVGLVVVRAWAHPALGVIATAGLVFLGRDFVRSHGWRTLGQPVALEDAAPLVRLVERERQDADRLLLHTKTMFIYAYYRRATPVLDPLPGLSTGWVPRIADPGVLLVSERTLLASAQRALAASPRVWFLTSRQRAVAQRRLRALVSRAGTIVRDHPRRGALLLELRRADPAGTGSPSRSR